MKKHLIVAAAWLAIAAPAFAGWDFVAKKDAMTDKELRYAMTSTPDGTVLSMQRDAKGAVILAVSLPASNMDMFDPKLGVLLRVDANQAHDFKPNPTLEQMGIKLFWWTPKHVSFVVWSGGDDKKRSRFLNEAMTGKKLLVRYYRATTGIKDFEIELDGLSAAMEKGLDIAPHPIEPETRSQPQ